jgi:peroxiredoxin
MKFNEALQTAIGDEIDVGQDATKKNKFEKLLNSIKKNDTLAMTHIVNIFPRIEIGQTLDKLRKRKKYKKYPGYDVAISKLEWRRSH